MKTCRDVSVHAPCHHQGCKLLPHGWFGKTARVWFYLVQPMPGGGAGRAVPPHSKQALAKSCGARESGA